MPQVPPKEPRFVSADLPLNASLNRMSQAAPAAPTAAPAIDALIARLNAIDYTAPHNELCRDAAAALLALQSRVAELSEERADWARRFTLDDCTAWEWATRATKAESRVAELSAEIAMLRNAVTAADDRAEMRELERDRARADAMEEAAKICDECKPMMYGAVPAQRKSGYDTGCDNCARAIRAKGNTDANS